MDNKAGQMKKISIVIPALNEEQGIERTIKAIPKDELERMGYGVHILVVDNGSEDGTGELARKAGAEVIFKPKRGYGRAFKTGFTHATGDIITTADADSTYPVKDIIELVQILEAEKLDFLTTNRFALLEKDAMSFRNKVRNNILSLTVRLLFRSNIKDSQSGMWVFRRSLVDKLVLKSQKMSFSEELKIEAVYFAKCQWKEIPIQYRARVGKVKLCAWRDGFGNLLHLIKKRIVR